MKQGNRGITVLQLLLTIVAILIIIFIICTTSVLNVISAKTNIIFKTITKQIDIEQEIKDNEKLLGTTDVQGEGITINILDGKDLVHQEDLVILVDELKNSGSQAISINEIRITNDSYIYCDGAVILIDETKVGNPFFIKAIGNKDLLYGAITRNKGYIETLNKDGIEIKVEKSDDIKIAKTNKEYLYKYQNKTNIQKLYELNQLVGKNDVVGKGVSIKIQETASKLTAVSFLQIVNDLNLAGAKAIEINGQRITAMTDMMDIASTYVLINSIPIKTPFTINVIGDVNNILEVLNYNNSYISKTEAKGNNVKIYKYNKIKIYKYQQKKDQDKMLVNYLQ